MKKCHQGMHREISTKKSSLYITHQKKKGTTSPSTQSAIQLEGTFRLTTSQEQFLLADDGDIRQDTYILDNRKHSTPMCCRDNLLC